MRKRILITLCLLCLVLLPLAGCSMLGPKAAPTAEPTAVPTATPMVTETPEPTEEPLPTDELAPELGFADELALTEDGETLPDDAEALTADAQTGWTDEQDAPADAADLSGVAGTATPPPPPTPDPAETPIPVDPLDKPTREPLGITYATFSSAGMGVSFDRPAGWTVNAPAETNVQFVEPEVAAKNGYPTQLTVRIYPKGSKQTSDDAKAQLTEVVEDLAGQSWTDFVSKGTSPGSLGSANGHYAYYSATWNDIKVRGRVIVVAHGNALYMMRITCPADFYIDYEDVYREVRGSWSFLSK